MVQFLIGMDLGLVVEAKDENEAVRRVWELFDRRRKAKLYYGNIDGIKQIEADKITTFRIKRYQRITIEENQIVLIDRPLA